MMTLLLRALLLNLYLLYNSGLVLGASNLELITDTVSTLSCIITLECTVNGGLGDASVWKGTVFSDCGPSVSEITLLHNRFRNMTSKSTHCNTSHITGRSIRVENGSYISQLEVLVKPGLDQMPLKSVTCAQDIGTKAIVVDSITINICHICMSSEILNDCAINHATTLKESQDLDIIIPGALALLFVTLVLITVPLLLCGLYKKFRSNPIGGRTPGEDLYDIAHQVVNSDKVGNYVEIMKSFDNKSPLGIYSLTDIDNYFTVQGGKSDDVITTGDTPSCNLKHSLVCALRGQVSSKWYSFGLALGVPKEFLNQLKCDSNEECLGEALEYWLKQHPDKPTWQEIMDAKNRIASSTAQYTCDYSVPH